MSKRVCCLYRVSTGKQVDYTGVLRSGESRSEVIPELQIISQRQYERAIEIMKERSDKKKANPTVPLNTKGKSLITGKIYCGHCGSRLTLTTNGRYRKKKDGSIDKTKRIRYVCYGKTRKQTECNGQTGYTLHILNALIDEVIRDILKK